MTLNTTIMKNMAAQLAGRFYTSAVSFLITTVFLSRYLRTTEDFGVFNFYLTMYYICITVIDFGSNTIVVRESSRDPEKLPGLLIALVKMRGVMSFICLLAVCGLVIAFEESWDLRLLICLASMHLLFYSLGGFNAVFHIKMRFDFVALISCIGHTLFLLASAVFLLMGSRNPAHYLIAYGIGMAGTNIANFLLSRRFTHQNPTKTMRSELGFLFRESLPLGVSAVMVTVYFYIDIVLLRILEGEAAVGLYSAAYRMLTFSLMVPVLFNQVIFPVFSRYFSDIKTGVDRLKPVFSRSVLYMGAVGIPAAAALFFLSEPVVAVVYDEKYARSSACLTILGFAMAAIFLTYPHVSVLVASGRQVLFAWIAGASGVLNVALNLILIPRYYIEGAAWATVITESAVLVAAYLCVRKYTGMNVLNMEYLKLIVIGACTGAAAFLLAGWNLFAALAVLGGLYLFLLFITKLLPFDIKDETRN